MADGGSGVDCLYKMRDDCEVVFILCRGTLHTQLMALIFPYFAVVALLSLLLCVPELRRCSMDAPFCFVSTIASR